MARYVLVAVDHGVDGQALESYDPDAFDGRGDAAFTLDPAAAMVFPDVAAALEEWRRVSSVRPWRADGKPNRPLTMFSVTPIRLEDWAPS